MAMFFCICPTVRIMFKPYLGSFVVIINLFNFEIPTGPASATMNIGQCFACLYAGTDLLNTAVPPFNSSNPFKFIKVRRCYN